MLQRAVPDAEEVDPPERAQRCPEHASNIPQNGYLWSQNCLACPRLVCEPSCRQSFSFQYLPEFRADSIFHHALRRQAG
jgi:hypothetical protein